MPPTAILRLPQRATALRLFWHFSTKTLVTCGQDTTREELTVPVQMQAVSGFEQIPLQQTTMGISTGTQMQTGMTIISLLNGRRRIHRQAQESMTTATSL